MAHPYAKHNEEHAGKARAKHLMKGYARGGKAKHSDEAEDRALFNKLIKKHHQEEMKVEGRATSGRLDKRARGGKTFAKGGVTQSSDTPKQDVKPLPIEPGGFDFEKLSEAEKAATPGTTMRKPSGQREHYKSGGKTDKFARGGHAKHHKGTNVNIAIVNPGHKDRAPVMPPPAGPALPPPGLPPGGPPIMPPPRPPMGGPPPGMPPMKRGGRAYAKGGKVPMTAGADSGEGRLQKIKAYGHKARS